MVSRLTNFSLCGAPERTGKRTGMVPTDMRSVAGEAPDHTSVLPDGVSTCPVPGCVVCLGPKWHMLDNGFIITKMAFLGGHRASQDTNK